MMQGWGITGGLLILFIIIVIVYILKAVVRSEINKSEFKRSVENDLQRIKEDIEILKSKSN